MGFAGMYTKYDILYIMWKQKLNLRLMFLQKYMYTNKLDIMFLQYVGGVKNNL